jgi:hypothetical protein
VLASAEDGADGTDGNDAPSDSKRHTPDQEAVVDLAQDAKRQGGVTRQNADTLVDWGKEAGFGDASRGPEDHGGDSGEHIHVGPINHIPVVPLVGGAAGIGVLIYLAPLLAL